jgi:threonine dehydratase
MSSMAPTLAEIRRVQQQLAPYVRRTPVWSLPLAELDPAWPGRTEAHFKLELLQVTGTFKVRGALNAMLSLTAEERQRGVTAVSAGNHAVAVAHAAKVLGLSAKVVMIKTANPLRVELTRASGAELEFAEHGAAAFARVRGIEASEGRVFIHPFEGPRIVAGTATLGLEWAEQCAGLDAVVVAVGGGGLIAGVATALEPQSPATQVFGVEPEGAAAMNQSFATGAPVTLPVVATIADSLAPPMTTPYTLGVCRQHVDRMVLVSDAELRAAMRLTLRVLKLAVEPAGAAALAAVLGPLRATLHGMQRVGILVCGSNIDAATFCKHVSD